DHRDRPLGPCRAEVRQGAGVVAADEQRHDARLDDGRHRRLDGLVAPLDVAGHDGHIAVVDARQDVEWLHVEVGVVRPQHHARGAHSVRAEPAAGAIGDAGVEGHADDREVDVLDRSDVRQPGEGRRPGEARALERVLRDVAGRSGARRAPRAHPSGASSSPGSANAVPPRAAPVADIASRYTPMASSTQHTTRSPGIARRSAVRTAVISSSTFSARVARAEPSLLARRTPSITWAAVSPGARPRRFLSSRTMISSNDPAAMAPYARWSSSRRSPGMPSTPMARPDRVPVAATPSRPGLVGASTIIRSTKSTSWRIPSTLWQ